MSDGELSMLEHETFDFDLSTTPDKNQALGEDEQAEEDVFFGPVGYTEQCIKAAKQQLLPGSPLSPVEDLNTKQMAQLFVGSQTVISALVTKTGASNKKIAPSRSYKDICDKINEQGGPPILSSLENEKTMCNTTPKKPNIDRNQLLVDLSPGDNDQARSPSFYIPVSVAKTTENTKHIGTSLTDILELGNPQAVTGSARSAELETNSCNTKLVHDTFESLLYAEHEEPSVTAQSPGTPKLDVITVGRMGKQDAPNDNSVVPLLDGTGDTKPAATEKSPGIPKLNLITGGGRGKQDIPNDDSVVPLLDETGDKPAAMEKSPGTPKLYLITGGRRGKQDVPNDDSIVPLLEVTGDNDAAATEKSPGTPKLNLITGGRRGKQDVPTDDSVLRLLEITEDNKPSVTEKSPGTPSLDLITKGRMGKRDVTNEKSVLPLLEVTGDNDPAATEKSPGTPKLSLVTGGGDEKQDVSGDKSVLPFLDISKGDEPTATEQNPGMLKLDLIKAGREKQFVSNTTHLSPLLELSVDDVSMTMEKSPATPKLELKTAGRKGNQHFQSNTNSIMPKMSKQNLKISGKTAALDKGHNAEMECPMNARTASSSKLVKPSVRRSLQAPRIVTKPTPVAHLPPASAIQSGSSGGSRSSTEDPDNMVVPSKLPTKPMKSKLQLMRPGTFHQKMAHNKARAATEAKAVRPVRAAALGQKAQYPPVNLPVKTTSSGKLENKGPTELHGVMAHSSPRTGPASRSVDPSILNSPSSKHVKMDRIRRLSSNGYGTPSRASGIAHAPSTTGKRLACMVTPGQRGLWSVSSSVLLSDGSVASTPGRSSSGSISSPNRSTRGSIPTPNRSQKGSIPTPNRSVRGSIPTPNRSLKGSIPTLNQSQTGVNPLSNRSQKGSIPTPNRSLIGSIPTPNWSQKGSIPTPNRSQKGSIPTPNRSQKGSIPTPNRSQKGSIPTPNWSQKGSIPTPNRLQSGSISKLNQSMRGSSTSSTGSVFASPLQPINGNSRYSPAVVRQSICRRDVVNKENGN
ncbi:PREDICTED: serine/arginine repetitive matrix protein 2-like [Priapulus caudatus]|uniref:Serine/arginine repetitive matrix protein 2-like n=1 Tax=Priapulus caudatus TaxID=37621 RepID=A0ABM1FAT1_PRICU|nr:PREDICTED: serine/arginine repetitive matrix protein 2-like [Priapulus caudatus]